MLPRVFSSCIYQLNNFVDSIFGSLAWIVGEGGVAVLYFAYHLVLFPIGVVSTALSQAILPTFSTQAVTDNRDQLKHTLTFGLRANFFMLLPASIGFMALAQPIIGALFRGGKFDAYSAQMTANALFFYSIGLFAYGATRILQSCFFALKDTATPAKVAALGLGLNVLLNSLLMFPLKTGGLALATSISGIITFCVLFSLLKKRLAPFDARGILDSFIRVLAASVGMGLVCYFISTKQALSCGSTLSRLLNLLVTLTAGVASYALFCFIFRVPEIKQLYQWLKRRRVA